MSDNARTQHVANNPVNVVFMQAVVIYDIEVDFEGGNKQRIIGLGTHERGRYWDEEFRCLLAEGVQLDQLVPGQLVHASGTVSEGDLWCPAMDGGVPSADDDGNVDGGIINTHHLTLAGVSLLPGDPRETELFAFCRMRGMIAGEEMIERSRRQGSGSLASSIPVILDNGINTYIQLQDFFASSAATRQLTVGKHVGFYTNLSRQYKVIEQDKADLLQEVPVIDTDGNEIHLADESGAKSELLTIKPHRFLFIPKPWRDYLQRRPGATAEDGGNKRRRVAKPANQGDLVDRYRVAGQTQE